MKEILLEADLENLHTLFDFVLSPLRDAGCSNKDIRLVKLCVEEVFTNIASYAYHPGRGQARVSIDIRGRSPIRLSISLYDRGSPFNPLTDVPTPDVMVGLEDRPIGGLGIHLVKAKMDHVSYEYRDGQNVLTMTKQIPIPQEG